MSDFAVIAELPLGAYRARTPGGHLDPVPSPVRLHAALLCAAATGPRAREKGGELAPSELDLATLGWLEQHPPDGVCLPRTVEVRSGLYAYRREGTLVTEGRPGLRDKVVARSMVGMTAVEGAFAWTWTDPPPLPVRESLEGLCQDVAYLGNADTPVRMRVGAATATHRRSPRADLFGTADGLDVEVPAPGRTAVLMKAHATQVKAPSEAADRFSVSNVARSADFIAFGRDPSRYLPIDALEEPEGPWSTVLLAGFGGPHDAVRPADHVGWATAVHRALIALVGDGAPAVLTGTYLPGVRPPANRVAIQLLTPEAVRLAAIGHDGFVLALLLPTGASGAELATVTQAFTRLRRVNWGPAVRTVRALPARSARSFWPQVAAARIFKVVPAAVPDTRPLRGQWSFGDAFALSCRFVLRDRTDLAGSGRGDASHRESAALVRQAGLLVHRTARVTDGDLTRYVHRIVEGRVVQPYRATVTLGGLVDDQVLMCVGQSRHLGGGLLVPVEEPDA